MSSIYPSSKNTVPVRWHLFGKYLGCESLGILGLPEVLCVLPLHGRNEVLTERSWYLRTELDLDVREPG